MSRYEFSLRQEVLLEKGSSVLGDLFRFKREKNITEQTNPLAVMYSLVWAAKQDVLMANTEAQLDQIEGQFDLAHSFVNAVEVDANA